MDNLQITDKSLELAARAAIDGGETAKSQIESVAQERKADSTIVTEADKQVDEQLRSLLTTETEFDVLSEEHGSDELPSGSYWVVDPIDGTQNYAYQQPTYGTAVALVRDDTPTVGCFYMPEFDYLFYARKGEGAYLNETELRVTTETIPEDAYLIGSGMGSSEHHVDLTEITPWIQRFCCALQAESYIAAGWSDAGVFGPIKPWDFAAGTVLVREAGGTVKRLDNKRTSWESIAYGGVVIANPELADALINRLSEEAIEGLCSSYEQFTG